MKYKKEQAVFSLMLQGSRYMEKENGKSECSVAKQLIEQSGKGIKEIKADGAYDTKGIRDYAETRGAQPLIPTKKNAVRRIFLPSF